MKQALRSIEHAAGLLLAAGGIRGLRIETDLASHHVYVGDGPGPLPPVVLLHGLSDSAASSALVMLRLRRRTRRIVAVEFAGHGRSGEPRAECSFDRHCSSMRQVLDAVIDEPAVLVGNSLGGASALDYALRRPGRVRAVLLTSPAGGAASEDVFAELRRTFAPRTLAEARALVDRLLHRPGRLAPLTAKLLLERTASRAVRDLIETLGPADAFTPEELARVSVPLHLVWGRSERLLPRSMLAYFRVHLPEAAVISEPDDFGHCPHLDDAFRFARLIDQFATLHS